MPLKTNTFEELPALNMTPMIDVVFLLIIFFMVGTQFSKQERHIDVKLPGVSSMSTLVSAPPKREVVINATGQVFLDGQQISPLQLTERLAEMRRRYPDIAVAVRADEQARQRDVIPVYGAISKAGVANMAVLGLQNDKIR